MLLARVDPCDLFIWAELTALARWKDKQKTQKWAHAGTKINRPILCCFYVSLSLLLKISRPYWLMWIQDLHFLIMQCVNMIWNENIQTIARLPKQDLSKCIWKHVKCVHHFFLFFLYLFFYFLFCELIAPMLAHATQKWKWGQVLK